ncbi:MAG: inorganic phosphate transporter [Candidatus Eisenbacteria bacterium]|nr:inorganic phosphate transporter [Candidatus Eisenbacteria bacterium]
MSVPTIVLFLLSGLFLGWSLGANDAANVFGTAVGSRMIGFRTAAAVTAAFVMLGAVLEGDGATRTLESLGAVRSLSGSFVVALAAAVTVTLMTRAGLPVSTSQAIVGGILGWNLYHGSPIDEDALLRIVTGWAAGPILAGLLAAGLFLAVRAWARRSRIHILEWDAATRIALLVVGAFGAYSLGANNIANVVGVFVPVSPFHDFQIGPLAVDAARPLFLVGAAAIGVGIFTDSRRVMRTVGHDLFRLTPIAALVAVAAESVVLYLFASGALRARLIGAGLPAFPLVPISSSQVVIGAVLGIGLAKGRRGVRFGLLGKIAAGWAVTPLLAALLCFAALAALR